MAVEPSDNQFLNDEATAQLAESVMQKQRTLSLRVAAIFLALLFGLPLFNAFFPEIARASVGGFTLSWLFLGILIYPLTWILSAYFIRESNRIETEIADEYRKER